MNFKKADNLATLHSTGKGLPESLKLVPMEILVNKVATLFARQYMQKGVGPKKVHETSQCSFLHR